MPPPLPLKKPPLFPSKPPLKIEIQSSPLFLKFGWRLKSLPLAHPPQQKRGGAHYEMASLVPTFILENNDVCVLLQKRA